MAGLQAIYDDNSIQAVQVREVFGLGVNYGFYTRWYYRNPF
jgi:S-formylglutathione hydrolase FrmB